MSKIGVEMDFNTLECFFKKLNGFNVYVGFSGGADSRFIIEAANYYKESCNFTLKAINFEHGIRGEESIEDSMFCKSICEGLDIPIDIISLNIDKNTKNIEAIAREKRLKYYEKIANSDKNHIILLGHHLDDKIENFFIRMSRGSNLSGLCGLKEFNYIGNIFIGRPLLNISKNEIVEYLNEHNFSWKTDSTNNENDYNRNFLRNCFLTKWFEKFSFVKGGVLKSLNNLEKDMDFIECFANDKFNEVYCNFKLTKYVTINFYTQLHESIRFRVLKKHIKLYIKDYELNNKFMKEFNRMIFSFDNTGYKKLKINNEYDLIIRDYKIYIEKRNVNL